MDIRRIIFEIIALVSFFALCYFYFYKQEVVGLALTQYIDTHGGITQVTMDQYFKSHNLEPDEAENNN